MPDTLQPPPEPDGPSPSAPEPYWRRQLWLPAAYRDSVGLFADVGRRMLSWMLRLRWRLHVDVRIRVEVNAVDEQAARIAVQAALCHRDSVIGLSRAEVDAVPPWRPLGTASRVGLYTDIIVVSTGHGAWRCVARMLATFTVDAADAAWPDPYFAVDIVPAIGDLHVRGAEADGLHIAHRLPTRRRC
jgi:hypothetical protein